MAKLIDMSKAAEEMKQDSPSAGIPNSPLYDYGLTLRLNHDTLEKLNLDDEDVEVGDLLDFRALAKVTSVSKNDTGSGQRCCVELQITHMQILENESSEYGAD